MTIYYTAKDIEEMAAKGIQQLEIGPGVNLTDFARETAQQFDIAFVDSGRQGLPLTEPSSPTTTTKVSDKYNKPAGCQHASPSFPAANSQVAAPSGQLTEGASTNTVNRLIDLMGKAIKRGG